MLDVKDNLSNLKKKLFCIFLPQISDYDLVKT